MQDGALAAANVLARLPPKRPSHPIFPHAYQEYTTLFCCGEANYTQFSAIVLDHARTEVRTA